MSNNGLIVTVVGWAASKPREVNGDGVPFTSFRVATTPRHFDKGHGAWADGRTEWLTVKVFRDVALNVAVSINKGDPVVVHGKLRTEEWQGENGPRSGMVVEASALGHDLTRGRSVFARTVHVGSAVRSDEPEGAGHDGDDPWARDAADLAKVADGADGADGDEPGSADEPHAAEDAAALTP